MTAEAVIVTTIRRLQTRPGQLVRIAELRERIGGRMSAASITQTLLHLDDERVVHLEPESDRLSLTEADHAAAIPLAGRKMHRVRLVVRR